MGLGILVPGIIIALMLVHIAAGLDTPVTAFEVSAGQAMAHLAIGATLRADTGSAEQDDVEAAADATALG